MIKGVEVSINREYDETNWRIGAACGDADPEIFHSRHISDRVEAKKICGGCSVAAFCLQDAIEFPDSSIRAGLTSQQRKRRKKFGY